MDDEKRKKSSFLNIYPVNFQTSPKLPHCMKLNDLQLKIGDQFEKYSGSESSVSLVISHS